MGADIFGAGAGDEVLKKKPVQGAPGGDIFGAGAPPPPDAGPAILPPDLRGGMPAPIGPAAPAMDYRENAQTIEGAAPGVGDSQPGPTYAPPPGGFQAPPGPQGDSQPGPTLAPPAAAPPAAEPINWKDPKWAAQGVDFNKIESGAPVPGQPGATFVHNGTGWTIQQGAGGAAPGAAPGAVPGAPGTPAPPPGPPQTVADAFKKTLIDKLNQGPASLNDPALKAQSDAYAVGQTRAGELQRAQSAERLAAQGLGSSGAADSEYSGITERAGENIAGHNAQLVGNAAKQQADEIRSYMAIAGNQLNAEEGRALQEKLANLDAQIRKEGIAQQGSLGQGDLALRGRLGEGQLNLGLLQALMQNQQFGRGLDQQGAQFGAGMDMQTIMALLGGLG